MMFQSLLTARIRLYLEGKISILQLQRCFGEFCKAKMGIHVVNVPILSILISLVSKMGVQSLRIQMM